MAEKKYTVKPQFNDCQVNDTKTSKGAIILGEASQKDLKRLYEGDHADMIDYK